MQCITQNQTLSASKRRMIAKLTHNIFNHGEKTELPLFLQVTQCTRTAETLRHVLDKNPFRPSKSIQTVQGYQRYVTCKISEVQGPYSQTILGKILDLRNSYV